MVVKVDSDEPGVLEKDSQPFSILGPFQSKDDRVQNEYRTESVKDFISFILGFLGCKVSDISREEAAREFLDRPIKIMYRPTIVELDAPSKIYE